VDTITLVENQIEDGQKLLDQLTEEGFVLSVACWIKPIEDDRWSLLIATPAVDQTGLLAAYHKVFATLRTLGEVCITDSDIKLVGVKVPVVLDEIHVLRSLQGKTSILPRPLLIGGIPIEEVHVYPLGKKKEIPIYGLIFRGEPSGLLYLSFEPHSPNSRFVTENMGQRNEYFAEVGIDWVVAVPEGATLARKNNTSPLQLVWNFRGNRKYSSANEVLSLAKFGLHGFRLMREPNMNMNAANLQSQT
jgi:hypothetical protein